MDADDKGIRDEIIAVESIFSENVLSVSRSCVAMQFPALDRQPSISVRVELPDEYPASSPPFVHVTSLALPTDALVQRLSGMWVPGEDVLFEWLTYVAQESEELVRRAPAGPEPVSERDPGQKREETAELTSSGRPDYPPCSVEIFHGEIVEVKKSKFQAHVCRIKTFDEVKEVMETLLSNSKVKQATHNMMAYRLPHRDDFDDDGEAQAGKRMLHMLQMMNVTGTMVVVSRWFGGTLLGPARFGIINNVAKDAINQFLLPHRP